MYEELIERLRAEALFQRMRFSRDTLASELKEAADALEAQSAQLVRQNAEIEYYKALAQDWSTKWFETHDDLARVTAERADLRNELCQQCGKYRMAHKGACDGCRWRTPAKQDEENWQRREP